MDPSKSVVHVPKDEQRCIRCGRIGNTNFVLVDRVGGGIGRWVCRHEISCRRRRRRLLRDMSPVLTGGPPHKSVL
jgi:hypothetical protein